MQLQFTFEQLRLLFRILEQDCRELHEKISQTNDIDVKRPLNSEEAAEEELLGKIINRQLQFSSDELDELAQVLRDHEQKLRKELSQTSEGEARQELKNRTAALEALLDKVVEACAML
jgi:transposase